MLWTKRLRYEFKTYPVAVVVWLKTGFEPPNNESLVAGAVLDEPAAAVANIDPEPKRGDAAVAEAVAEAAVCGVPKTEAEVVGWVLPPKIEPPAAGLPKKELPPG